MNQEKRFSNKIIKVSFWLSICVVYIHANNTTTYQFNLNNFFQKFIYIFENWSQGWQQCAVPLFMMISGFLFFRNYNNGKYLSKLKSRVKSLLIPYLIWTNIPWFTLSIVKLFPFASEISTNAKFTLESWINFTIYAYGTVLWYVKVLIIYVLIAPLIYKLLKNKKLSLYFICIIFACNAFLLSVGKSIPDFIYQCVPYLIGAWLSIWKSNLFTDRKSKKICLIGLGIFLLQIFIAIDSEHVLIHPTTQYIYKMSLPLPLWIALDIFSFSKPACKIEKLSFPIYCTHSIILETLEKIIYILGGNNIVIAGISYIFMPIFVVTILVFIFLLFDRYFSNIYKFVFGNRG